MFRLKWTAVILCIVVCNLAVLDFFTVLAICPPFPVAPIQTRPLFSQMLLALEWWMGGWSSPSQSTRLVPTTCFSSLLPGWGPPVPQPDLTPPSNIEFKSFWRVGGFPMLMKTRWRLCWFWWGRELRWMAASNVGKLLVALEWRPLLLALDALPSSAQQPPYSSSSTAANCPTQVHPPLVTTDSLWSNAFMFIMAD